ncbi:MAG: 50S ribosomal protein L6 [bacterium]
MSRVGRKQINIPDKVKVTLRGQQVEAAGPLGKLAVTIHPRISITIDKNIIVLTRTSDNEMDRSLHGMERSRVFNIIEGASQGYTKELTLVGVGYRSAVAGNSLNLQLGYSHPIEFKLPPGIQAKVDKQTIISLTGSDKDLLGLTAARLRALRPPEPYKGKGIRYTGEHIIRKAGKSAVAGGKK